MSVLTLTVDGQPVAVPAGASLLQAVEAAGISLPRLCHLDGLTPVGACRLCLVAVEGSPRPLPACVNAAAEGQVVRTDSEELRRFRRLAVELFFAEGNHVCAICVANGSCELQAMAVAVGMDHCRFPYQYPHRRVDASHPQFTLDRNRCILCSRCVRVCQEIEGAHVWDIASRGSDCQLIAGMDQPWAEVDSCTSCGKCVEVCPTGALFHKDDGSAERQPRRDLPRQLREARELGRWTPPSPHRSGHGPS
ncbi:MAG: bidirectional hydrogenase complex protein HoxU [Synechococcaceae cyanobacterium]|nr:bidirectional hydrogenase complex protein HoxU [Synechococcaceae cyanobacterium]